MFFVLFPSVSSPLYLTASGKHAHSSLNRSGIKLSAREKHKIYIQTTLKEHDMQFLLRLHFCKVNNFSWILVYKKIKINYVKFLNNHPGSLKEKKTFDDKQCYWQFMAASQASGLD